MPKLQCNRQAIAGGPLKCALAAQDAGPVHMQDEATAHEGMTGTAAGHAPDEGYVTALDYTYRYCPVLAPARIALACAARGIAPPANPAPRYLELAIGQGVSLNIHAAACPGAFEGVDFNPRHAANARELAAASTAAVRVSDDSFESFLARRVGVQFDHITLHGTWSWISAANRHLVVEILRRHLAPGGACLVSYNCLPGWAAEIPLRRLLTLHASLAPADQPLSARIDSALGFVQCLHEAGAGYFDAHPRLGAWLERLQRQDRAYLAHEYFNRDWHPATSDEVAQAMAGAGLEFATSTGLAEQAEATGFAAAARDVIESIAQPALREAVLDLVAHRSFRSDIFVRNGPLRAAGAPYENIADVRFVLLQHPDYLPGSAQIGRTRYALPAEVYRPFAIAMAAQDYAPKSLRDLAAHPECRHLGGAQLAQAALVLTDAGCLHPTQPPADRALAARRCAGLNALILKRAATATEITALASPLLGAGVAVAREEMLFLRARLQGLQDHDEWARHAWESMGAGDPALLRSAARAFARIRLPVLRAVGVA